MLEDEEDVVEEDVDLTLPPPPLPPKGCGSQNSPSSSSSTPPPSASILSSDNSAPNGLSPANIFFNEPSSIPPVVDHKNSIKQPNSETNSFDDSTSSDVQMNPARFDNIRARFNQQPYSTAVIGSLSRRSSRQPRAPKLANTLPPVADYDAESEDEESKDSVELSKITLDRETVFHDLTQNSEEVVKVEETLPEINLPLPSESLYMTQVEPNESSSNNSSKHSTHLLPPLPKKESTKSTSSINSAVLGSVSKVRKCTYQLKSHFFHLMSQYIFSLMSHYIFRNRLKT